MFVVRDSHNPLNIDGFAPPNWLSILVYQLRQCINFNHRLRVVSEHPSYAVGFRKFDLKGFRCPGPHPNSAIAAAYRKPTSAQRHDQSDWMSHAPPPTGLSLGNW